MRKRLVTLIFIGVLSFTTFTPVASAFSSPVTVFAADKEELSMLGEKISFNYVTDKCISVKSLSSDLYVIAFDGSNFYQLSRETSNDDGVITSYSFKNEAVLDLSGYEGSTEDEQLSKAVSNGDILVFSGSDFNSENDVRGIFSQLSNSVQSYLFFDSKGCLIANATPEELKSLVDSSKPVVNTEFSAKVTGYSTSLLNTSDVADGAYIDISYKLADGDVLNNIFATDKDGNTVSSELLNSDSQEGVVNVFLKFPSNGDYTLTLVTGKNSRPTTVITVDGIGSEVTDDMGNETDVTDEVTDEDKVKPEVTFSNTDNPTEYGDVLTITMKSSVDAQMRFGASTNGEYQKSADFDITENGTYKYVAITKAGEKTEGTIEISCFKSSKEMNPDVEVTIANATRKLPQTGVVATGLIIAGVGAGAGAYMIKKGIKRKEDDDNEAEK